MDPKKVPQLNLKKHAISYNIKPKDEEILQSLYRLMKEKNPSLAVGEFYRTVNTTLYEILVKQAPENIIIQEKIVVPEKLQAEISELQEALKKEKALTEKLKTSIKQPEQVSISLEDVLSEDAELNDFNQALERRITAGLSNNASHFINQLYQLAKQTQDKKHLL